MIKLLFTPTDMIHKATNESSDHGSSFLLVVVDMVTMCVFQKQANDDFSVLSKKKQSLCRYVLYLAQSISYVAHFLGCNKITLSDI